MTPTAAADLSRLHALVPVRGLTDGKVRLGFALDAEERVTLVLGLLINTLDVMRAWGRCELVHVISADGTVLDIARRRGAAGVVETSSAGLNAALVQGREAAVASAASAILCLPADLPFVSVPALDRFLDAADAALAAGSGQPLVAVAPADARDGTNALLMSPPRIIDPCFGEHSLAAHVGAASAAGASVQLVVDPHLGFDLDTPDDLERVDAARLLELLALGADHLARNEPLPAAEPA